MRLEAPLSSLYDRVASVQPSQLGSVGGMLVVLVLLATLFLIIQGSALVGGVLLARSITSAVHELFEGTERVRSGDFAHRIAPRELVVVAARHDRSFPPACVETYFARAGEPKTLLWTETTHVGNQTPDIVAAVLELITAYIDAEPAPV